MREIKFRGKRIDNGEWTFGNFVSYKYWITDISVTEIIPETVGKFTGLKDKDGKEIFEGDIIRIYEYFCEEEPEQNEWEDRTVEWDECGQCLSIKWDYGDFSITSIGWAFEHFGNSGNKVEVIGNIYDNPELLQGGIPNE